MTKIRIKRSTVSSMSSNLLMRTIIAAIVMIVLAGTYSYTLSTENSTLSSISSVKDLASSSSSSSSHNNCLVSFGKYNGHKYKSPGQTIGNGKCLVESKWMQIMQHTVKLNEESDVIINDWLFINYHDRINVLVQDPASTNDDPSFLVFKQSKYALEGRQSLAVVGGIIEPNENAKDAASREVSEEMGVICKTFQELGRFRTDVNRGMGWVNGFLARDCTRGKTEEAMDVVDEVGKPDTERQDLISIKLADLRRSAMAGDFLEVQWSNTVALALLHLVN